MDYGARERERKRERVGGRGGAIRTQYFHQPTSRGKRNITKTRGGKIIMSNRNEDWSKSSPIGGMTSDIRFTGFEIYTFEYGHALGASGVS